MKPERSRPGSPCRGPGPGSASSRSASRTTSAFGAPPAVDRSAGRPGAGCDALDGQRRVAAVPARLEGRSEDRLAGGLAAWAAPGRPRSPSSRSPDIYESRRLDIVPIRVKRIEKENQMRAVILGRTSGIGLAVAEA